MKIFKNHDAHFDLCNSYKKNCVSYVISIKISTDLVLHAFNFRAFILRASKKYRTPTKICTPWIFEPNWIVLQLLQYNLKPSKFSMFTVMFWKGKISISACLITFDKLSLIPRTYSTETIRIPPIVGHLYCENLLPLILVQTRCSKVNRPPAQYFLGGARFLKSGHDVDM